MQYGNSHLFQRLICDLRGNASILFGLLLLPIVGLIGLSIDYARAMHAHSELQEAADAAAIAGARLPATANYNRYEAATKLLAAGLELTSLSGVTSSINASNAEVVVKAEYALPTVMLGLMGIEELQIKVSTGARSQIENGGVACLVSLSETSSDGLHLQGINQAAADNCWAWVNSSSATSINADGAAKATAQGFCTVGRTSGAAHFGPAPYTGCAPMEDPFAQRFASAYPDTESCTKTNVSLKNGIYTLSPGVYCGNTILKPQAHVTFEPGTYVFKNGILEIQGQASATGNGVTFVFDGPEARPIVRGGGAIDIKAPTEGDLAGFLIVKRAEGSDIREMIVQGGGRVNLVGVIYAPEWRINISGNGEINQDSQFFAMVADDFYMEGNGRLWIRSDAAAAGMPDLMPRIKSGPVLTH